LDKIREIRKQSKKILLENNSLNIYKDEVGGSFYGLEDDFIKFLKLKIIQAKKYKGRGILISYHKYNEELRIERLVKIL